MAQGAGYGKAYLFPFHAGKHCLHRPLAAVGHGKDVHRRDRKGGQGRLFDDGSRLQGRKGSLEGIRGDDDVHDGSFRDGAAERPGPEGSLDTPTA